MSSEWTADDAPNDIACPVHVNLLQALLYLQARNQCQGFAVTSSGGRRQLGGNVGGCNCSLHRILIKVNKVE